jgi:hypothetical protein
VQDRTKKALPAAYAVVLNARIDVEHTDGSGTAGPFAGMTST